jgi:hypothetical protein
MADTYYVSPEGSHTPPFTNWLIAATGIQSAVNYAEDGDTVLVTNGLYLIQTQIDVTNGISLQSVNGAFTTIVDASRICRVMYVSHSNASLQGFTISQGQEEEGAGIYSMGAEISRCVVVSNHASDGGGIYAVDSKVWNCEIKYNYGDIWSIPGGCGGDLYNYGGGIYSSNSTIVGCHICDNLASGGGSIATYCGYYFCNVAGGGVYSVDSLFQNCLIAGNRASVIAIREPWGGGAGGGGLCVRNSTVYNCTIADNTAHCRIYTYPESGSAGGVRAFENDIFKNCIIANNTADLHANYIGITSATYTCSSPLLAGTGNIADDPAFVNMHERDYHLSGGSPCIDAGSNVSAPTNDLDGVLRPLDGSGDTLVLTDMGAYEVPYPFGAVPELTNAALNPQVGTQTNVFTFSIDYQDAGGEMPVMCRIYVDNTGSDMDLSSGTPANGTYVFNNRYSPGRHDYFFLFASRTGGVVRWPSTGYLTNLYVGYAGELTNGLVNPIYGNASSTFTYQVTYYDVDPVAPSSSYVYIDGAPYSMTLDSGVANSGVYQCAQSLTYGVHEFYFLFNDGISDLRLPVDGVYTGPAVNSLNHYVSPEGAAVWPYDSWANAGTSIYCVLEMAWGGDAVFVTNGAYALSSPIRITNNVTLASANGKDVTILDGSNAVRCLELTDPEAVVEGFNIIRGTAVYGGAVQCLDGTVRDCRISWSQADKGGAVYCGNGTIRNCLIDHNIASVFGGGVFCSNGTVQSCTIVSNSAGNGGGVYCLKNSEILACEITDNTATNVALPNGGGGVYCSFGGAVLRCLIASNKADNGGGVFTYYGGLVENTLVIRNQADSYAGGILCRNAGDIQSCTIAGNTAGTNAGGVGLYGVYTGYVHNTIIYLNTVDGNTNNYNQRPDMDYSYCCAVPLITNGTGNIDADPHFISAITGSFRLVQGSACIDGGSSAGAPDMDIDGVIRPLDGNDDGLAEYDIGAYEHPYLDTIAYRATTQEDTGQLLIYWVGIPGASYDLMMTTNISLIDSSFILVPGYTNIPGQGSLIQYTNQYTDNVLFYYLNINTNAGN